MSNRPTGEIDPSAVPPVDIPAGIGSDDLLAEVSALFEHIRLNITLEGPSEDMVDTVEGRLAILQEALIERAEADPANQPEAIIARVAAQYRAVDPYAAKPISTFDQAVSRYMLNTHRIREVDLAPYDEAALLKAAVIAGINRGTKAGNLLARRAVNILRHEASNIMYPPRDNSEAEARRFITQYSRAAFSIRAFDEISQREDVQAASSLDEVLKSWSSLKPAVVEDNESSTPFVSFEEDGEEKVQFRPLLQLEADERLKGLRVIGEMLKTVFGEDINVRYFETVVFEDADEIIVPAETDEKDGAGEDEENHETSPYFTSDYIVAEVTRLLPDGERVVDIVAESPNYGNACYVLRADVVQGVSELLDEPLDWRDVFRYFKVTARQLGATSFRHYSGSNVPQKVVNYLASDVNLVRDRLARRWLRDKKAIYDQDMHATRFNRLPLSMRNKIAERKADVKSILESWLEEEAVVDLSDERLAELGEKATAGSVSVEQLTSSIEAAHERIRVLEAHNAELSEENIDLRRRGDALEATVEQMRKVLSVPLPGGSAKS